VGVAIDGAAGARAFMEWSCVAGGSGQCAAANAGEK
jgi:hypothetical protein